MNSTESSGQTVGEFFSNSKTCIRERDEHTIDSIIAGVHACVRISYISELLFDFEIFVVDFSPFLLMFSVNQEETRQVK
jgi:hypothetical protein